MEQLFLILELVGTLAFAASGAITGLKKNMDVFGVCILGLTTAVGGGVIRDLLLGITPPGTFQDPIYAVVALLTSLVLFLPRIRRLLMWDQRLYDLVLLIMDSAGLGIFTVAGIRIAYEHAARPTLFLLVFVGVVTGVGGGVLRDVLAGDTPYIFVKQSMPPPPWPGRWPAWSSGPWRERWPPCSAAVRLWSPSASSPPTSAGTCLTPMTEQTASPDRERSFSVRGTLLQAVNVRARIRRFSHAAQWRCQVLFSISAIHAGIVSIPSAFLTK